MIDAALSALTTFLYVVFAVLAALVIAPLVSLWKSDRELFSISNKPPKTEDKTEGGDEL